MMYDVRLLEQIQAVALDMDGVIWRGEQAFEGLVPFFDFLHEQDIPFVLATNNSTQTVGAYVDRINGLGYRVTPANVVTSAVATAEYVRATFPNGVRVHILGETGLLEAMREAGYESVATDADVVVVGMDRGLTYEKLKRATYLIRNGARFVGTNGDLTFPLPDGLAPGAGSILAALRASSGQAPVVIGKPEPIMFELTLARLGVPAARALMVGDRLETDILGAQQVGLRTALVLSGVTTAELLAASAIRPDLVFDDLRVLYRTWVDVRGGLAG
jgi:4-nitrophenyl phosphatase